MDVDIRTRLAEIMSSAGLGYNQISLEILYLLPKDFIDRYVWLWEQAMGPAGSGDSQGQALARTGELGKAKTQTKKKGDMPGAGAGSGGKRWKAMGLSVRDQRALDLKTRIDKRLRSIARDIRVGVEELSEGQGQGEGEGGSKEGGGRVAVQCSRCGRIMAGDYRFCPYDGQKVK